MNERPIPFSGPMVRAIREGRKTQTRRVIKPWPMRLIDDIPAMLRECPYGVPGDRLWVRETWQCGMAVTPSGRGLRVRIGKAEQGDALRYRADGDDYCPPMPWRSPLHMPRWASRITLEIVSVRVQRVQDISEEDAKAEGVLCNFKPPQECQCKHGYRPLFENLWDSINSKRGFGWDVNPWVWVVEFKEARR